MNIHDNITIFYETIKSNLNRFIIVAEDIARANGINDSEITVAKIMKLYVSKPLIYYNITEPPSYERYNKQYFDEKSYEPPKDILSDEQKKVRNAYNSLGELINSQFFGKYLQRVDTIEIIDKVLKIKAVGRHHSKFSYDKPERYFFAKCLSLGIKRIRENLGLSFQEIASYLDMSVSFVRNLENCRAGTNNYECDNFCDLIVTLTNRGGFTFQYLLLASDGYNQDENGYIRPMTKIDDRRTIELKSVHFFFKQHSDITAALFKIISDCNSKEYIDSLRNVLFEYCEKIDIPQNKE